MKDNNKQWLYCPHCQEYPDEIEDRYTDILVEKRRWYEGYYEIQNNNMDELDYKEFCGVCGTELVFKEQKTDE